MTKLMLAVDHSPLGLNRAPRHVIDTVMESVGMVDGGVLCEYGVARELTRRDFPEQLVIRLDGNECYLYGDWTESPRWQLVVEPETAALLKPKAFAINLMFGFACESASLDVFREVAAFAVPNDIEMFVSVYVKQDDPGSRRSGVRMACEYGADTVSIAGVKSVEEIPELSEESFRPLWLGGGFWPNMDDIEFCKELENLREQPIEGVLVGTRAWRNGDARNMLSQIHTALDA